MLQVNTEPGTTLQETNMTKEEQVVFINAWLNQGYNVFFPAECDKALVAIIVHNSLGFGEMFLENINAVSRYQMWWAMGDWNPTPCGRRIWSFLPANTKAHPAGNDGCARSMRWEGDKCACKTQSRKELCHFANVP